MEVSDDGVYRSHRRRSRPGPPLEAGASVGRLDVVREKGQELVMVLASSGHPEKRALRTPC